VEKWSSLKATFSLRDRCTSVSILRALIGLNGPQPASPRTSLTLCLWARSSISAQSCPSYIPGEPVSSSVTGGLDAGDHLQMGSAWTAVLSFPPTSSLYLKEQPALSQAIWRCRADSLNGQCKNQDMGKLASRSKRGWDGAKRSAETH